MPEFKDAAVAAKYTSDHPADPIVHLPGGKTKKGWKGKLSQIPIEQADRWYNRPGQNLLKLKEAKPEAKAKAKTDDPVK